MKFPERWQISCDVLGELYFQIKSFFQLFRLNKPFSFFVESMTFLKRYWKGPSVTLRIPQCPSVTSWCKGRECHHWWWSINIQQQPQGWMVHQQQWVLVFWYISQQAIVLHGKTLPFDKQNYLYNVYPACIIFYPPCEWQMQLAVMGKLWSHPASHPGPSPSQI